MSTTASDIMKNELTRVSIKLTNLGVDFKLRFKDLEFGTLEVQTKKSGSPSVAKGFYSDVYKPVVDSVVEACERKIDVKHLGLNDYQFKNFCASMHGYIVEVFDKDMFVIEHNTEARTIELLFMCEPRATRTKRNKTK